MKEASGEANLTVVAILLIGVVAAIVTPLINNMMNNARRQSCCSSYGGVLEGKECTGISDSQGYNDCVAGKDGSEQ